MRAIDWRATARRTEPVVRTWRPERDRRVLIVLDVSRLSAARFGDAPRLEAQLEAALLLAALASRAGDRVELVAVDRAVRARVAGASGARAARRDGARDGTPDPCSRRAELARGDPRDPRAAVPPVPGGAAHRARAGRDRQRAPAGRDGTDPGSPRGAGLGLGPASWRSCAARAVRAPRPSAPPRRNGRVLERDAAAGALRRKGIDVVAADPDELAPALADAYLALKAAGRL